MSCRRNRRRRRDEGLVRDRVIYAQAIAMTSYQGGHM